MTKATSKVLKPFYAGSGNYYRKTAIKHARGSKWVKVDLTGIVFSDLSLSDDYMCDRYTGYDSVWALLLGELEKGGIW